MHRPRLALVAVVAALVAAACGHSSGHAPAAPTGATTYPPGWTALPPPPLVARSGPAVVFTGNRFLLFGGAVATAAGNRSAGDGAAYDLTAARWSLLPPSPVPNLRVQANAWVAGNWVLLGRDCPVESTGIACVGQGLTGMAYSPSAARWEPVVVPPSLTASTGVIATGTSDGAASFAFLGPGGTTYDSYFPADKRWTAPTGTGTTPASGICGNGDVAVEVNYRGRLADGSIVESDPPHLRTLSGLTYVSPRLTVVDLRSGARDTTELPGAAFESSSEPRLRCVGTEAVLVGARAIARYDLGGRRWQSEVTMPGDVSRALAIAGTNDLLLVGPTSGLLVDPATGATRAVPVQVTPGAIAPARDGFAVYSSGQLGLTPGQLFVFDPG